MYKKLFLVFIITSVESLTSSQFCSYICIINKFKFVRQKIKINTIFKFRKFFSDIWHQIKINSQNMNILSLKLNHICICLHMQDVNHPRVQSINECVKDAPHSSYVVCEYAYVCAFPYNEKHILYNFCCSVNGPIWATRHVHATHVRIRTHTCKTSLLLVCREETGHSHWVCVWNRSRKVGAVFNEFH